MAKVQVTERFVRTKSENRQSLSRIPKMYNVRFNEMNLSHSELIQVRTESLSKKSGHARKVTINSLNLVRQPWERYMSVAVHLFALLILSLMILDETKSYNEKPTGTIVADDMYPVQEIDFPAVGICNINLISRQKAFHVAEELWTLERVRNIENITLERVKSLMRYMGHFFMFEDFEHEPGDMKLLDEIFSTASNNNSNLLKIMEYITPTCRLFLIHCKWGGERRSCDELFVPRWTQDGLCCTFNYVRWNENFHGEPDPNFKYDIERLAVTGTEYGLQIFMEPQLDDYYYGILPGQGFKILIYTASDYPDAPSGGLREILVSPGSEVYLKLRASAFYSSPEVIKYDKRQRRCLFNTELDEIYQGSYSYSQCMMLCRTRDIFKNCGCFPFFYPFPIELGSSKNCDLKDLACLKRYRHKWWSTKPTAYDSTYNPYPRYDNESTDENLDCDCLPTCENVHYMVFKTASGIHLSEIDWTNLEQKLARKNTTDDSVLLIISFGMATVVRLRQDVLYYWYDLMSNYGGLCSLFLGLSILTPIKFIYLICLRMCRERRKENKFFDDEYLPANVETKFGERSIYWSEILPTNCKFIELIERNVESQEK